MKKLLWIGLGTAAVVTFIGADVVVSGVQGLRNQVRAELTSEIPLSVQLQQARVQIDGYAESIIQGEVRADQLRETVARTEREVRGLEARVEGQRHHLLAMRESLGYETSGGGRIVPANATAELMPVDDQEVVRQARSFQRSAEMLARRKGDLERLENDLVATLASLEDARQARVDLSEQVHVLQAELASLEARKMAARTRDAVGDSTISESGFGAAQAQLDQIRARISEQDKMLRYYEVERSTQVHGANGSVYAPELPADPASAIDEALATWPGR